MSSIREQRAAHYRTAHGRPSQRRNAAEANYRDAAGFGVGLVAVRAQIEVREAATNDDRLLFTGYASMTDKPYQMYDMFGPYTETVSAGAFGVTLAQDGLDVPLVIQHKQDMRLARTTLGDLRLSEDGLGLRVEADLDPTNHWAAIYVPQIRSGLMDEMSFAFRITKGSWSEDYETYSIDEVDIHRGDVAIVGYGANPYTDAGVREPDAEPEQRETPAADAAPDTEAATKTRADIPREYLRDIVA